MHRMWRIGSLYLLALILGAMLHYIVTPGHMLLGSSAAVYGLIFAFVANLLIVGDFPSFRVLSELEGDPVEEDEGAARGPLPRLRPLRQRPVPALLRRPLQENLSRNAHRGHPDGPLLRSLHPPQPSRQSFSFVFVSLSRESFGCQVTPLRGKFRCCETTPTVRQSEETLQEHKWETILRRLCFIVYSVVFVCCVLLVRLVQPYSNPPWTTSLSLPVHPKPFQRNAETTPPSTSTVPTPLSSFCPPIPQPSEFPSGSSTIPQSLRISPSSLIKTAVLREKRGAGCPRWAPHREESGVDGRRPASALSSSVFPLSSCVEPPGALQYFEGRRLSTFDAALV